MAAFAERGPLGRAGRGHTGRRIRNVVNIGIGGSDLGPGDGLRGAAALQRPRDRRSASSPTSTAPTSPRRRATSTRPRRCSSSRSKTFTTLETMTNARTARGLAAGRARRRRRPSPGTSWRCRPTPRRSAAFGIDTANMFGFWDWVGGRYSSDSAIGLSLMVADRARRASARCWPASTLMDEHFRTAPLERNLPVLLGLLGVWYDDFFGAETHAVLPYSQYLEPLPGLPPAARHGEQRQVGRPRRPAGRRGRPARRLGRAGHQRPARLLPADPPGHQADPGDFIGFAGRAERRSATTTTC